MIIKRTIQVLLLSIVLVVFAFIFFTDVILNDVLKVHEMIAYRASKVIGTNVTIKKVSLNFSLNKVTLSNITIANPREYGGKKLFSTNRVVITYKLDSLLSKKFLIKRVDVYNSTLNYKLGLTGSNLDKLASYASKNEKTEKAEGNVSQQKSYTLDVLEFHDLKVNFQAVKIFNLNFIIGKLTIKDPLGNKQSVTINGFMFSIIKELNDQVRKIAKIGDKVNIKKTFEDSSKSLKKGLDNVAKSISGIFK